MTAAEGYTISEVSRASGVSRMTLYRAIKDGRLNRYLARNAGGAYRLTGEVMDFIRGGGIRARIDSPWVQTKGELRPPLAEVKAAPPDVLVTEWANALLADTFGPPPWPPHLWSTLRWAWDEASELAALHGAFDPAVLEAED